MSDPGAQEAIPQEDSINGHGIWDPRIQNEIVQGIQSLQRVIQERDGAILELNNQMEEKSSRIKELMEEKNIFIAMEAKRVGELRRMHFGIQTRDLEIRGLKKILEDKEEELKRNHQLREELNQEKDRLVEERDNWKRLWEASVKVSIKEEIMEEEPGKSFADTLEKSKKALDAMFAAALKDSESESLEDVDPGLVPRPSYPDLAEVMAYSDPNPGLNGLDRENEPSGITSQATVPQEPSEVKGPDSEPSRVTVPRSPSPTQPRRPLKRANPSDPTLSPAKPTSTGTKRPSAPSGPKDPRKTKKPKTSTRYENKFCSGEKFFKNCTPPQLDEDIQFLGQTGVPLGTMPSHGPNLAAMPLGGAMGVQERFPWPISPNPMGPFTNPGVMVPRPNGLGPLPVMVPRIPSNLGRQQLRVIVSRMPNNGPELLGPLPGIGPKPSSDLGFHCPKMVQNLPRLSNNGAITPHGPNPATPQYIAPPLDQMTPPQTEKPTTHPKARKRREHKYKKADPAVESNVLAILKEASREINSIR